MTPRPDPYRVLGLVPGASPGEIRSAYRRLAKLNHPDTAGERSLPRFLAIQAAYEELAGGEGRRRARGWASRPGGTGAGSPSGARRASRDAWRARQAAGGAGTDGAAGGARAAGTAGAPGAGASASAGASAGGSAGRGPADGRGPGPGAQGARQRGGPKGSRRQAERRTARPGSTTYDEAAQPLDPSWDGARWYGASSGRYWTLNPREYADPRKHGPEYQERARRAARRAPGASRDRPEGDPPDDPAGG